MGDLQSLLAAVSEDCNQKHKEIQKTTKNMRRKCVHTRTARRAPPHI